LFELRHEHPQHRVLRCSVDIRVADGQGVNRHLRSLAALVKSPWSAPGLGLTKSNSGDLNTLILSLLNSADNHHPVEGAQQE
jgi:hypothetical protein